MDYKTITKNLDRRATSQLIGRLLEPSLGEEEGDEIHSALRELRDPRSEQPLWEIFQNRALPFLAREIAGDAWFSFADPNDTMIRDLWSLGANDPLIREVATGFLNFEQADLIDPLLGEPEHPLYPFALEAVTLDFPDRYLSHLIDALNHPSPSVRKIAAHSLFWEEPVVAGDRLRDLALTDPDSEVRVKAINTLRYYTSRQTLRLLAELRKDENSSVAEFAGDAFSDLTDRFQNEYDRSHDQAIFRQWFDPVIDLLDTTKTIKTDTTSEKAKSWERKEPCWNYTLPDFISKFGDLNQGNWWDLGCELLILPYEMVPHSMRNDLRGFFRDSKDPLVREIAVNCFKKWKDKEGFVGLLDDRDFLVRKSAFYHLRFISPDHELADLCWDKVLSRKLFGTHGYEVLNTSLALLDDRALQIQRASQVLADDTFCDALRYQAVSSLHEYRASAEIATNLWILSNPVATNWDLVTNLINCANDLGIPLPDVSNLAEIDDLDLQKVILTANRVQSAT